MEKAIFIIRIILILLITISIYWVFKLENLAGALAILLLFEILKNTNYKAFIHDKLLDVIYLSEQFLLLIIGSYAIFSLELNYEGIGFILLAILSFRLSMPHKSS